MLDRLEYHESGYIPCKASRETIPLVDLENSTRDLWKSNLLRNEFPSGYCRGRAFLISKMLDDRGIKSQILTLSGYLVGAYAAKGGYRVESYLEHFVNIIEVDQDGSLSKFVIDPMFTDRPVPLAEYLRFISPPQLQMPMQHKIMHQSYADKLDPPFTDKKCQYNIKLLKDYESEIAQSLVSPPPSSGPKTVFNSREKAIDSTVRALLEFNAQFR